jgi:hypothetical protein
VTRPGEGRAAPPRERVVRGSASSTQGNDRRREWASSRMTSGMVARSSTMYTSTFLISAQSWPQRCEGRTPSCSASVRYGLRRIGMHELGPAGAEPDLGRNGLEYQATGRAGDPVHMRGGRVQRPASLPRLVPSCSLDLPAIENLWRRADLNCRPRAYETPALPLSYPAKGREPKGWKPFRQEVAVRFWHPARGAGGAGPRPQRPPGASRGTGKSASWRHDKGSGRCLWWGPWRPS